MTMIRRAFDRLFFALFSRWFRVVVTDPVRIAQIKEEFGIVPLSSEKDQDKC